MINCSGNKIPLVCVFAAIAIVFIHGLSLAVAPGEPEVREPEARAWATAENEPARPKAGVVFLAYSNHCSRKLAHCHRSSPIEVVYAGRLLKKIMKPAYPTLLFANKAPRDVHGVFDNVRELNLNASLYTTEHAGAVQSLLSANRDVAMLWCGSQGLTCHAMYDDSGNSCCIYKGNKLSCDYTGDASDMDFICECWP